MIARTSTFTYKGKAVMVQEVSRELGVRYVLEGSVRKAGGQVRITSQLVDATTGYHLWAERYDRPMRDIFAVQDEIVRRIVTTLNLQLTLWEKRGVLVHRRTDNLDAYDDFLRGLKYSLSHTREGSLKAQRMFEKAVALDPNYATRVRPWGIDICCIGSGSGVRTLMLPIEPYIWRNRLSLWMTSCPSPT